MNISEKNYINGINGFLIAISLLMLFRKPCTWLIIVFAIYGMINYNKLEFPKERKYWMLLIASPFLLEVFFIWNNDSIKLGFKSLEKTASLVVFPILIVGNYQRIKIFSLFRNYAVYTTILVVTLFFRFIILYPDLILKYLKGIDLFESGYMFAESFGIHAPALNMHLAFISCLLLYFVIESFEKKTIWIYKANYILLFLISFLLILIINTRIALVGAIIGYGMLFYIQIGKKISFLKVLKKAGLLISAITIISIIYIYNNPYMKEKYSNATFSHMDKIGRLDEIEDPEKEIYNAMVTRLTIWKTTWEIAKKNLWIGVGSSDSKIELFKYYRETNQKFLSRHDFPVHNQFLDFLLKFGIVGFLVAITYVFAPLYLGIKSKQILISIFFVLFFASNMVDDYLIKFDGIAFSGLWISIFIAIYCVSKNQEKEFQND